MKTLAGVCIVVSIAALLVIAGHDIGKQAADRWYREHPNREIIVIGGGDVVIMDRRTAAVATWIRMPGPSPDDKLSRYTIRLSAGTKFYAECDVLLDVRNFSDSHSMCSAFMAGANGQMSVVPVTLDTFTEEKPPSSQTIYVPSGSVYIPSGSPGCPKTLLPDAGCIKKGN